MVKLIKRLFFILISVLLQQEAYAQKTYKFVDRSQEVDRLLTKKHKENTPGGTIAVLHKGKLVFNRSYGLANTENTAKIDDNSQFYVASVAKTFTSAAILYLWERNRIGLDDKASKYISGIPVLDKVTIRQLLTHTSGIPDYYDAYGESVTGLTNEKIIEFINSKTPEFKPGTDYAYSNTAYIVLALIVEAVSKQSFPEFLAATFFRPLNMDQTLVYDSGKVNLNKKVTGYNKDNTVNDYRNYTYGSGGIYSSKSDLIKWYKAIRNHTVLKKETLALAFTPPKIENRRTYMAMGWNYEDCPSFDKDVFSVHTFGMLNGFRSYIFMIRELDFGVIMLSNNGELLISPYEILSMFFEKTE